MSPKICPNADPWVSGAVAVVDVASYVDVVYVAIAIVSYTVFIDDVSCAAAAGFLCVIVVVIAATDAGVVIWATATDVVAGVVEVRYCAFSLYVGK